MNEKPCLKSSGGFEKVMDKNPIGLFSEMGIRNSGTSSSESLPFTDLERLISGLLDNSCPDGKSELLLPKQRSWNDIFIEEKSNYFIQVCSNIMETKRRFLQFYANMNENIEDMTRQILQALIARERELKAQLQLIKAKKVAKWDRQLSACGEALKRLHTWEKTFSDTQNGSTLNYLPDDDLVKELEFVDAGLVNLNLGNFSKILESLHTLGEITDVSSKWGTLKGITPKLSFGTDGDNKGQFCRPWGVCSDATGRILVCDRSNHRIQIFNECGQFLIEFGKLGSEPGEFNRPSGIDVDSKCRIVVADKDNHRIQVFTYSGFFLLEFGTRGTEPGEFMYPWDVSINRNCDIAVSDSKNNRVQLFDEGGRFITLLDAKSMGICPRWSLKFLDSPRGLAFCPNGSLLVTDFNNHQVLMISKDFKRVTRFGQQGSRPAEFFRPQGIACYKTGKFAVADSKNYRVQVFDASGRFLKSFGSKGADLGQFDCPQGICFHPNQNILVVDLNNNRIQVF